MKRKLEEKCLENIVVAVEENSLESPCKKILLEKKSYGRNIENYTEEEEKETEFSAVASAPAFRHEGKNKHSSPKQKFRDIKEMFENLSKEKTKSKFSKTSKREDLKQILVQKVDLKMGKSIKQIAKLKRSSVHPPFEITSNSAEENENEGGDFKYCEEKNGVNPNPAQPSSAWNQRVVHRCSPSKLANISPANQPPKKTVGKKRLKSTPSLPRNYGFKPITAHFKPVIKINPLSGKETQTGDPPPPQLPFLKR